MRSLKRIAVVSALITTATNALAHGGHAVEGAHWHASDAWGFVVVMALAAAAVLFSRGDR
ncbi:hypothetical protein GHT07_02205 [Caenimonas koreensis DSM 17982]|uniref:MYXO-CTERM domain-containing protein n=1 Tax=Caenimonas koreensis DSM 17982 TaxID=1121255 RepID=A0A844APQ2_9BURK|nr:hypothetical protein [Caenimonas koreensis]MRD46075.1 hypothetical protein [Caenimonas koreensis DSM 17982]